MDIRGKIKEIYKERVDWVHKGRYGKVLVVGGSKKYTGSVVFNAVAALRSGCDLVTVAAPVRAAAIAASFLPDLITFPLEGDSLNKTHVDQILHLSEEANSMVLGCGLGKHNTDMIEAFIAIVNGCHIPMVLDAEALRMIGTGGQNFLAGKTVVLTPHSDEFYSLTGQKVTDNVDDRVKKVKEFATYFNATVVLKGHIDVISDGKDVVINNTGSVYMTKGGFGDTLTGICGSLLAQGVDPFSSGVAAAYLNGKAGALAVEEHGVGVLASDLLSCLPHALKQELESSQ